MTVRLVTYIQNRLFRPSALARLLGAGFPVYDTARNPEMGSDMSAGRYERPCLVLSYRL